MKIKIKNKNIEFEYGKFIQTLGTQLKEQTENKYILKNSSYWTELAESTFTLYLHKLISKEELERIINDLDLKVRNDIQENPVYLNYKYKKISQIKNKYKREEIINKIIDLYFNQDIKQINIARLLKIDPKSINYIVLKEQRKIDKSNLSN